MVFPSPSLLVSCSLPFREHFAPYPVSNEAGTRVKAPTSAGLHSAERQTGLSARNQTAPACEPDARVKMPNQAGLR